MNNEAKIRAVNSRVKELRPCEWCKTPFSALKVARFCSNRCRQAAKYARQKGTHKACTECGKTFMITHGNQEKCSDCRK